MTKKEYLSQLDKYLTALTIDEREDIMTEIEERFRVAQEKGEKLAQVIEKLGTPEFLAQSYLKSEGKDEKELAQQTSNPGLKTFSKVMLILALLALNGFLILWLWFAVFMLVFAMLMTGGAVLVTGMVCMATPAIVAFFPEASAPNLPPLLYFMSGLTVVLFSILGILLVIWLAMWLFKMFVKYVKFNISLVQKV